VTVEAVKMGPFTDPAHPGKPNIYSTEEHGHLVPATLLPAFPAGTFIADCGAHQQLPGISPHASSRVTFDLSLFLVLESSQRAIHPPAIHPIIA
jgi:hypothetical protein